MSQQLEDDDKQSTTTTTNTTTTTTASSSTTSTTVASSLSKINQSMIVPCEFVIYATLFLHEFNRVLIGGGGGHGIPNKIIVLKFDYEQGSEKPITIECDFETGDEVVWNMKYEIINNIPHIVYASLDKIHLLQYNISEKQFKELDSTTLYSNIDDLGKKICDINTNGFIVANDDNNTLYIYKIRDEKLNLITSIEQITAKNISDMSLSRDNVLGIISEDKAIKILQLKEDDDNNNNGGDHHQVLFSNTIPNITQYPKQDFKLCSFPKNSNVLYTLHTSRSCPTFISTYKVDPKGGVVTQDSTRELLKRPATAFSVLIGEEDGKEYISLGVDGGVQLFKQGKHIGKKLNIHSEAITCMNLCKDTVTDKDSKKNQQVHICSGSIDRSVSVQHLSANKPISTSFLTYLLYIVALILLIFAVLYAKVNYGAKE